LREWNFTTFGGGVELRIRGFVAAFLILSQFPQLTSAQNYPTRQIRMREPLLPLDDAEQRKLEQALRLAGLVGKANALASAA